MMAFNQLEDIIKHYDLGPVVSIAPLNIYDYSSPGCSNPDVVRNIVVTDNGTYLHKRYNDPEKKPRMLGFLDYLKHSNIPCQKVIDASYHQYKGVDSLLFNFVPGVTKKEFSAHDYVILGGLLCDFHQEGIHYTGRTIVHRDCHPGNIVWNGIPSLIDLDSADEGNPEYDIAMLCFYKFALESAEPADVDMACTQILSGYYEHGLLTDDIPAEMTNNLRLIIEESKNVTYDEFSKGQIDENRLLRRERLFRRLEHYHFTF